MHHGVCASTLNAIHGSAGKVSSARRLTDDPLCRTELVLPSMKLGLDSAPQTEKSRELRYSVVFLQACFQNSEGKTNHPTNKQTNKTRPKSENNDLL